MQGIREDVAAVRRTPAQAAQPQPQAQRSASGPYPAKSAHLPRIVKASAVKVE
jgi:hypothetical protein